MMRDLALPDSETPPQPEPPKNWTPRFWLEFSAWSNALQAQERRERGGSGGGGVSGTGGRVMLYGWRDGGGVCLCIGCEFCGSWRSSSMPSDHDTGDLSTEEALFAWAHEHGWSVEPPRCPTHLEAHP